MAKRSKSGMDAEKEANHLVGTGPDGRPNLVSENGEQIGVEPIEENDRPPTWTARNKRAIREWTFDRIEEALAENVHRANAKAPSFRALALAEARHTRNVAPLRSLHPDIADLIHPPKRGRGKHGGGDNSAVDLAIRIERIVRDAWSVHYERRSRDDQFLSAEQMAIEWLRVHRVVAHLTIDDMNNRKKRGSRPRTK